MIITARENGSRFPAWCPRLEQSDADELETEFLAQSILSDLRKEEAFKDEFVLENFNSDQILWQMLLSTEPGSKELKEYLEEKWREECHTKAERSVYSYLF